MREDDVQLPADVQRQLLQDGRVIHAEARDGALRGGPGSGLPVMLSAR